MATLQELTVDCRNFASGGAEHRSVFTILEVPDFGQTDAVGLSITSAPVMMSAASSVSGHVPWGLASFHSVTGAQLANSIATLHSNGQHTGDSSIVGVQHAACEEFGMPLFGMELDAETKGPSPLSTRSLAHCDCERTAAIEAIVVDRPVSTGGRAEKAN